ncbi:hypothetical protein YC2023_084944 [Brassica napus]
MGLWRLLKSQVSHFILIALKVKLLVCIYLVVHVDILSYWFNRRQLGKAVPEVPLLHAEIHMLGFGTLILSDAGQSGASIFIIIIIFHFSICDRLIRIQVLATVSVQVLATVSVQVCVLSYIKG